MKPLLTMTTTLALLGACGPIAPPASPQSDSAFCTPLLTSTEAAAEEEAARDPQNRNKPTTFAESSTAHFENLAYDCLNRYARRYSPGKDSADAVARAVATACAVQIGFETSQASFANRTQNMDFQMVELASKAEEKKFVDEAERLVIEVRAGKCSAPQVVERVDRSLIR